MVDEAVVIECGAVRDPVRLPVERRRDASATSSEAARVPRAPMGRIAYLPRASRSTSPGATSLESMFAADWGDRPASTCR